MGRVRRRGRGDGLSVYCNEAVPYELPAQEEEPSEPPVEAPRMEEWPGPGQVASSTPNGAAHPGSAEDRAQVVDALAGQRVIANGDAPVGASRPAANHDISAPHVHPSPGEGPPVPTKPLPNGSGQRQERGPQKLLINLTETEHVEEDARLLKEVLQLLLEFPGSDGVDLVIASQGKRWRLEMPIITTSYCPELEERLNEMLGRQDAVTVQAAPA